MKVGQRLAEVLDFDTAMSHGPIALRDALSHDVPVGLLANRRDFGCLMWRQHWNT
jgi:hypothetical protein